MLLVLYVVANETLSSLLNYRISGSHQVSFIIMYTGAIAARGRLLYDNYPVHVTAVNCTGVETRLYGCSLTFNLEDAQSCAVDQGVICQGQIYVQCGHMY